MNREVGGVMATSQLRKGVLDLVVISSLATAPAYGGALLERLARHEALEVVAGTLYPLLARLRRAGLLDAHWEESPSGPPRKVYTVTPEGRRRLGELKQEWRSLQGAVEHLVAGAEGVGSHGQE